MSSHALMEHDLKQTALGMAQGEANLQTPFNGVSARSRVYIRNHSASVDRQYVKVPVSFRRGAQQALQADAELRKHYSVATVRESVAEGIDMNIYAVKKSPVLFATMWNGKQYRVPPAKDDKSEAPRVQVPEGVWDLLMGNWERMHSPDPQIRGEEQMRLATSMTKRNSAILFVTIDGEREQRDNAFGFIEIERVTENMEPINPDSEFLTALELVEG